MIENNYRYVYYGNIIDHVGNMVDWDEKINTVDDVMNEYYNKTLKEDKKIALYLANICGLEDLRTGCQYMTILPTTNEAFSPTIISIKQNNNGLSFLVSNIEIPYYKKIMPQSKKFVLIQQTSVYNEVFLTAYERDYI